MIDHSHTTLQIIPIPAFEDNYIWLIHNETQAIVVDPGDATPVIDTLQRLNLNLVSILITHHHQDHIGGVEALQEQYPEIHIFAPTLEKFSFKHTPVCEPNTIQCAQWLTKAHIFDLPGHTIGHVAYYIEHDAQKWLFCGDTLFGAGCGRLREGSPEQMFDSLQKLAKLPQETQVFCTHEYTLQNINFALTLEPNNHALIQRHHDTVKLRHLHQPSLPSNIALELATNPFLRCHSQQIKSSIELNTATELGVFTKIRTLKNHY